MRFGVAFLAIVLVGVSSVRSAEEDDLLARRFKDLDTNKDGKLSAEELSKTPILKGKLEEIDADGDEFVSLAELRTAVAQFTMNRMAPNKNDNPNAKIEVRRGPKILKPSETGVGRMIPDLGYTDVQGKSHQLSDLQSSEAIVIAFTSTSCPICQKYTPSLARLEKQFADKKVAFLFVNPTPSDEPKEIKKVIAQHGFRGSYVHDTDGKLTATLDARSTGEVFVLDSKRTLIYRGAVDDQYGQGYSLESPRETYLKDALESFLAHEPIRIRATEAPGCALEPKQEEKVATSVTYHNRVSRIVQEGCLECHRKDGLAPFSLEKPEDLISHQAMIRKVVENGTMPPWYAAPPEKGKTSPWANDRSLPESDKKDLIAWLKSDRPLGNEADAPKPREFPKDWAIGKPDLVLELPREVSVKAEGIMPYQNLIVETKLTEDKWVQALEVQPTARAVVHHVLVFVLPPGTNGGEDDRPGREERQGFFAAYVPGNSTFSYAPGLAKKLPKGSRLRFQMHYTPNGTATTDRTKLGLIFATEEPKHEVKVIGLVNPRLQIPPGADNHPEVASLPIPSDAKILTFMPHMHLRGKAFRYEVTTPDKKTQTLLDVPAYDFNWQLAYRYADPILIPRGSTLKATGWYDNSKNNPANPDPTKTVKWGPQTYDEMMLGYVEYYFPTR